MEKRLPLFFLLSFLVLVLWPRPQLPEELPVDPATGSSMTAGVRTDAFGRSTGSVTHPTQPSSTGVPLDGVERPEDEPQAWRETLSLGAAGERGHFLATFDSRGGVLSELRLGGYYISNGLDSVQMEDPENWVPLMSEVRTPGGLESSLALRTTLASASYFGFPLDQVHWAHRVLEENGRTVGVQFTHDTGQGLTLSKTVRVQPGSYDLSVDLELRNSVTEWVGKPTRLLFTPAVGMPASAQDAYYMEPSAGVSWEVSGELEVEREALQVGTSVGESFPPTAGIRWAGVDSKYFAALARPDGGTRRGVSGCGWRPLYDLDWVESNPNLPDEGWRHLTCDLDLTSTLPAVGDVVAMHFELYAGPKHTHQLEEHDPALLSLVDGDLGFFSGIASLLLTILGFFHGLCGNWGWSIILLTLTVRLVLFPFNRRSQTSMARHAKKMKRVQPMLNELKEKYKDNPQKQRSEQARIMQEEGAFPPLGGCLPIFLQIPVFFGLFKALRVSFDLRQAPFMAWIEDLSEPDRLMRLDWDLPLLGTVEYLNVLPPLMVVLWIVQQKVMPKPTDEQALKMQKMMMWMPIVFGFFLYNYAAGLSLYMITTSMFGVLEQTVIKKIWPIDDSEQPKKKSGFMVRMAELQKQAQKMQEMQKAEQQKRAGQKGKRSKKR